MTGPIVGVGWYRFRTTFGRNRAGYLTIVVLVALLGGLAFGSIAAARRTQSSFTTYLASTDPGNLNGVTSFFGPQSGAGYDPARERVLAHLAHVEKIGTIVGLNILPLGPAGAPENVPGVQPQGGLQYGSVNGDGFSEDRFSAIDGHVADPRDPHQFVANAATAKLYGFHLGESVMFGVYTNSQTERPTFGTRAITPRERFAATLVGIVVSPTDLFQDDVDKSSSPSEMLFTPALTDPLLSCCAFYAATDVFVSGGSRFVPVVQHEIASALPQGFNQFVQPSSDMDKAQRSLKPESLALGAFGAIVALATLLIVGQVIGRQFRLHAHELATMRALGAGPATIAADGLLGIVGAVVIGSLLAVAVAVGLSPLSPLGPVRPVYPHPGVAFDWTVVGFGLAALVVVLSAAAVVLAWRTAPHRLVRGKRARGAGATSLTKRAAALGLPAPAVTGLRFALEPGTGRNAVPVRSAMLGTALAMIVLIGTVTFGASLNSLVSHPALYGWNWNYILYGGAGADIPQNQAGPLLRADHDVSATTGVYFGLYRLDGRDVPIIGAPPGAPVTPPLLSGHGFDTSDEVVLGPVTMAQLHKEVGDSVVLTTGLTASKTLRIVGTATLPAIGNKGNQHTEMGTGALLSYHLFPPRDLTGYGATNTGPGAILVRLRDGSDSAPAWASLQRIANRLSNPQDFGVTLSAVERPAEIVNYRSLGSTPAYLGIALALGAVAALGLTLVASVRRRQHDLALLKTLGFTGRQLAAVVSWQSTVAVVIGAVVGMPLGIIVGRTLWDLFANAIHAVPAPSVPALSLVVIVIGALVLANVVAAVPGRIAARTSTGVLLRAE